MNDQEKSLWAIIDARDGFIANLQYSLSKHRAECEKKEAVIQQLIAALGERDARIGEMQELLSKLTVECSKKDVLIQQQILGEKLGAPLSTPIQRTDGADVTKIFPIHSDAQHQKQHDENDFVVDKLIVKLPNLRANFPEEQLQPHPEAQNFRFFFHKLLGAFRLRR